MNDFTKEELKTLLNWRDSILYIARPSVEVVMETKRLSKKIKSMIDNYCEPCPSKHEFYDRLVCEKCGQIEGF